MPETRRSSRKEVEKAAQNVPHSRPTHPDPLMHMTTPQNPSRDHMTSRPIQFAAVQPKRGRPSNQHRIHALPNSTQTSLASSSSHHSSTDIDYSTPHNRWNGEMRNMALYSSSDEDESLSGSDTEMTSSVPHPLYNQTRRKYTRKSMNMSESVGKGNPDGTNKVLKNREAAQQFRQRQREHLQMLQDEYEQLTEQNRIYRESMHKLTLQRESVDKELVYAKSFLEQAMAIAMANLRNPNISQLEPICTKA